MSLVANTAILHTLASQHQVSAATLTFMNHAMHAESGGKANAVAKTSSASGLFQFIDSTWRSVCKQNGLDASKRFDPQTQCEAMIAYTKDNAAMLRPIVGHEPTAGELYLAHFMGPDGAKKALSASDDTPVSHVMTPGALKSNAKIKFRGKSLAEFTVGDLRDWANARMNVKMDVREAYQKRHDAHQTTPVEDEQEFKERTRILKEFGVSDEMVKTMRLDNPQNILGTIFLAILKFFMDESAPANERHAGKEQSLPVIQPSIQKNTREIVR